MNQEPSLLKLLVLIGIGTLILFLIAGTWFVATSDYPFHISTAAYLRTIHLYLFAFIGAVVGTSAVHLLERLWRRRKSRRR